MRSRFRNRIAPAASRKPASVGYVRQRRDERSLAYLAIEELKLLALQFSGGDPVRRNRIVPLLHRSPAGDLEAGSDIAKGKRMKIGLGSALAVFALSALVLIETAPTTGSGLAANNVNGPVRQPYTAEYELTSARKLPDGTTKSIRSTEVMSVDSQGRVATAVTGTSADGKPLDTGFRVVDPVRHAIIQWSQHGTTVHVINAPDVGGPETDCARRLKAYDSLHPHTAEGGAAPIENLGSAVVDGVLAQGGRVTFTFSNRKGSKFETGERTNEVWTAADPSLGGMRVRVVSDAGEFGRNTRDLLKLTIGEPDAAVFEAPKDRTVTTESKEAYHCSTGPADRSYTLLPSL
jgi:hypothetical protein